MGTSSVSCALSGITLNDEPVVFLPIVETRYAERIEGGRIIGRGPEQCRALCSPLTLPFRGVISEYVKPYKIEDTPNTQMIAAWSKQDIQEFTESLIRRDEPMKIGDEEKRVGVCFFHPEVFEKFSRPLTGKYAGSMWQAIFAGRDHLELLGCTLVDDLGESATHRYIYVHPEIPGVRFATDGDFTETFVDDEPEALQLAHGPDDIHKRLRSRQKPGFPRDAIRKLRGTSELEWEYKEEAIDICRNSRLNVHGHLDYYRYKLKGLRFLEELDSELITWYLEQFTQDNLLPDVVALKYLLRSFDLSNRMLMPTICRTQDPAHSITMMITKFIANLSRQRVTADCKGRYE